MPSKKPSARSASPAAAKAAEPSRQGTNISPLKTEPAKTLDERLATLVLPAQLAGVAFLLAEGELYPGQALPVSSQSPDRPLGLAGWVIHTPAAAATADTPERPATRHLNLAFRPLQAAKGPEFHLFPKGGRDAVEYALCLPMSHGPEPHPREERLEQDLTTKFFHKPAFVICLQRPKPMQGMAARFPLAPVLMEIYDPRTRKLIWQNPFMDTLEKVVASILGATAGALPRLPVLATAKPEMADKAAPVTRRGPEAQGAQATASHAAELFEAFRDGFQRGLEFDEVVELVHSKTGLLVNMVRRQANAFLAEHPELRPNNKVRVAAIEWLMGEAMRCGIDRDHPEFWLTLEEASGDSEASAAVKGMSAHDMRALYETGMLDHPPSKPTPKKASRGSTSGPVAKASALHGAPEPEKGTPAWHIWYIRNHQAYLRGRALEFLKAQPNFTASPRDLRAYMDIPASAAGEYKPVADSFRRYVMEDMVQKKQVANEGSKRCGFYRLLEGA